MVRDRANDELTKDVRRWARKTQYIHPRPVFCRRMAGISRKQGMSGGSVLAHMTDAKDAADKEKAPFCRAKNFFVAQRMQIRGIEE